MAKEYATKNPIYSYDADTGEVETHTEEVESIYKASANAVLEEIEQAIKDCDVDGSPYAAVLDKIKQLKGE